MGLLTFARQAYNFHFSSDKHLAKLLRPILGFTPIHMQFYREAFIHRSFYHEENTTGPDNERLEYLGDAVLGAIIAEYLYNKYPGRDEGFLTLMRSKMVNRKALNELADNLGFDVLMRQLGGKVISEGMLGNAFEAFIGAIYLDVGFYNTREFVFKKLIRTYYNIHKLEFTNNNFKSLLLEYCQKNRLALEYRLMKQYKRSRRDCFEVAVCVGGSELARAEDFSKKSAEQSASQKALLLMGVIEKEEEQ